MRVPLVYDLTPMTRNANQGRRFVISGIDIQRSTLLIGGISAIPGILVAAILFPFINVWALLAIPMVMILGFWLINGRSSQGMKLKNYQTLMDKTTNKSGKFFICGHEIDVTYSDITYIRTLTAPIKQDRHDVEDLFALDGNTE